MKEILNFLKILLIIFCGTFLTSLFFLYLFFGLKNLGELSLNFLISQKGALTLKKPAEKTAEKAKKTLPLIIHKQKTTSDKGLYITLNTARDSVKFSEIKQNAKASGLNTLVIDAKDILARPLLEHIKKQKLTSEFVVEPDPWLYSLCQKLHQEGFIVTVRLVVFKDDHLTLARPDLAINLKKGGLYRDNRGGRWADPYSDEVRLYNELIAERAAASGADEIQFDYVRFPAEGANRFARYLFEKEGLSRVAVINIFLEGVQKRLKKYNVSLAVDIFGITAWLSKNDIENLGQDLYEMAQFVDVISPMLYPSHFHAGYDGYPNPGSEPYYFINTGVKKSLEILGETKVKIIPWIQGFKMRSPNFGPDYILKQIQAAQDAGASNYLIWNAGNVYESVFKALVKVE